MVFKHFRFQCSFRVLLLAATIFLFVFLFNQKNFVAATFLTGLLILLQVASLIHFIEKTNRDLARFLFAIKYEDFSQTFTSAGLGKSFSELHNAFRDVLQEIRQARAEKEENFQYLRTLVQHIGVGLIVYRTTGEIQLINTAAQRLLQKQRNGGPVRFKSIRDLEKINTNLVQTLLSIHSGDKALVKWQEEGHQIQMAIFASEFRLRGQRYKLASIQNIHPELEEKEMEAWQTLIRVLTHEIMNSITPISSLALTAGELLAQYTQHESANEQSNEELTDIQSALKTIQKRSQGLLHFVEAYRKLSHIPKPDFRRIVVKELFHQLEPLLKAQIKHENIELGIFVKPETLELVTDPELLEQVLLNLLMNAIQAVDAQPNAKIALIAKIDARGFPMIQVRDNGPGIPETNREKIFIPFFTTKSVGSGIGLSLSKQIMRLLRGSIVFHSEPGKETVFTLQFSVQ